MNDTKTAGPKKLTSLRLVRETLRELYTDGLTRGAGNERRTHGRTCTCTLAG